MQFFLFRRHIKTVWHFKMLAIWLVLSPEHMHCLRLTKTLLSAYFYQVIYRQHRLVLWYRQHYQIEMKKEQRQHIHTWWSKPKLCYFILWGDFSKSNLAFCKTLFLELRRKPRPAPSKQSIKCPCWSRSQDCGSLAAPEIWPLEKDDIWPTCFTLIYIYKSIICIHVADLSWRGQCYISHSCTATTKLFIQPAAVRDCSKCTL